MKTICLIIAILFLFIAGISFHPVFGNAPTKIDSSNWNKETQRFENIEPTVIQTAEKTSMLEGFAKWFYRMATEDKTGKVPSKNLPSDSFDWKTMKDRDFVWLGHSTVLMKLNGQFILTDPVFFNAAPVLFVIEPFPTDHKITLDLLPPLDVVLLSHDHYDHLDYQTITKIKDQVKLFITPLGLSNHLTRWGISSDKIKELDWWGSAQEKDVTFTLVPSRHFSGRTLVQNKTLWGAFVIQDKDFNIFFSGDGGYDQTYKKVFEKFGAMNFTFMENGAYNEKWNQIHKLPPQNIQAIEDLHSMISMPIHWAKFDLAEHKWNDPINYFYQHMEEKHLHFTVPKIGQKTNMSEQIKVRWWDFDKF